MGWQQRARMYYHRNKRHVHIILASILIGILLLSGNWLYYKSTETLYQQSMTNDNQQSMLVEYNSPASIDFTVDSHRNYPQVTLHISFDPLEEGENRLNHLTNNTIITPELNGRSLSEIKNINPGQTATINVPQKFLNQQNLLVLRGDFRFSREAQITGFRVTGHTQVQQITYRLVILLGIIILLGPLAILYYIRYKVKEALEDRFPDFLRDVVEGTRSGMSLPRAIKNTQSNDYGRLTPHVRGMSAKLDWGIPFEKVLNDFAQQSGSQMIRRSVNTIIQTYQSGGNVSEVLESVGNNLQEIEKLRSERRSELYGEMITGYVVYAIFLVVLVVLTRYLIPSISFSTDIGPLFEGNTTSGGELVDRYRPIFRHLVMIQSVFSGFVIGKFSRGTFRAGVKHVFILILVGYFAAAFLL